MLRLAALLLLLANVGYYSWSSGLLAPWGLAPEPVGEPERLTQQIAPQTLQLLPPQTPEHAPNAAAPPPIHGPGNTQSTPEGVPANAATPNPGIAQCLTADPLDAAQTDAVRGVLASLPADSWTLESRTLPGQWTIYMGGGDVKLGTYFSEEAAQSELAKHTKRGVTAYVQLTRPPQTFTTLRLHPREALPGALLLALRHALDPTQLAPCTASPGPAPS